MGKHGMRDIVLTPAEGDTVARQAVQDSRGDVKHLLNPIIGTLRRSAAYGEAPSAEQMQQMAERLTHALDVMDALCGQRPLRELLAEAQQAARLQQG